MYELGRGRRDCGVNRLIFENDSCIFLAYVIDGIPKQIALLLTLRLETCISEIHWLSSSPPNFQFWFLLSFSQYSGYKSTGHTWKSFAFSFFFFELDPILLYILDSASKGKQFTV